MEYEYHYRYVFSGASDKLYKFASILSMGIFKSISEDIGVVRNGDEVEVVQQPRALEGRGRAKRREMFNLVGASSLFIWRSSVFLDILPSTLSFFTRLYEVLQWTSLCLDLAESTYTALIN